MSSKILFMPNVYTGEVFKEAVQKNRYQMPTVYRSNEKWIDISTPFKCCNCDNDITKPIFIPQSAIEHNSYWEFAVRSPYFCSFPCALTHIHSRANKNNVQIHNETSMLKKLASIWYNKKIKLISPAPNREELQIHGGRCTQQEISDVVSRSIIFDE